MALIAKLLASLVRLVIYGMAGGGRLRDTSNRRSDMPFSLKIPTQAVIGESRFVAITSRLWEETKTEAEEIMKPPRHRPKLRPKVYEIGCP